MGCEPDIREQVGQVRRFVRRTRRVADGQVRQNGVQLGPWLNLTQLRTRNDAQQDGGSVATAFAADEQPVFVTDRRQLDLSLGQIVINAQAAIFCVAAQRVPLIERVRERLVDLTLRQNGGLLFVQPGFEFIQNRMCILLSRIAKIIVAELLISKRLFQRIQTRDVTESFMRKSRRIVFGLPPVAAAVSHARDFDHIAICINFVIAAERVGLQIACEILQELGRIFPFTCQAEFIHAVTIICVTDIRPELAVATLNRFQHFDARIIGVNDAGCSNAIAHQRVQWLQQISGGRHPAGIAGFIELPLGSAIGAEAPTNHRTVASHPACCDAG